MDVSSAGWTGDEAAIEPGKVPRSSTPRKPLSGERERQAPGKRTGQNKDMKGGLSDNARLTLFSEFGERVERSHDGEGCGAN
jgi:hypothetical protein